MASDSLAQIVDGAAEFSDDPYGFVLWAYPWGEAELKDWPEPDVWQTEYLKALTEAIRSRNGDPIRIAAAAANGVGKSALLAWLVDWAMSTGAETKGTVTANTALQLKTKTWAELSKWRNMSLTADMFKLNITSMESIQRPQTWRMDAVPWSKEHPEAVAGLHNHGKRILVVMDEASGIDDIIWEYGEASLTDEGTEIIWAVFGNTTRNSGRFKECWGKFDRRWLKPNGKAIINGRVDGRRAKAGNKRLMQQWIDDYGEDSDFVRVRVKAEFPRVGDMQFFPSDWISSARQNRLNEMAWKNIPATFGVDVATSGNDRTVITCRRGQKVLWQRADAYTPNTMQIVGKVLDFARSEQNMGCICVDANGVGKGVADRLSELIPNVVHVYGSASADDSIRFRNKRAELYDRTREWLKTADLPENSVELFEEMEGIQHGFSPSMQTVIETKADMHKRLGKSPDFLDSLIYSHADMPTIRMGKRVMAQTVQTSYWK